MKRKLRLSSKATLWCSCIAAGLLLHSTASGYSPDSPPPTSGFVTVSAIEKVAAISVTGKVTDDANQPLPGVNILLKGTTTGTTSDANGDFALTVPDENGVLVFSFIGYTT